MPRKKIHRKMLDYFTKDNGFKHDEQTNLLYLLVHTDDGFCIEFFENWTSLYHVAQYYNWNQIHNYGELHDGTEIYTYNNGKTYVSI